MTKHKKLFNFYTEKHILHCRRKYELWNNAPTANLNTIVLFPATRKSLDIVEKFFNHHFINFRFNIYYPSI